MTTLLLAALAFQIGLPGQYPPGQYPPGQYPPGRDPGSQGPGIPFPRRGKKTTASDKKAAEEPTLHYTGKLRTFDEKSLEILAADTRTLVFQLNEKTKKPADLSAGDEVAVEAREDDKGYYIAVSITKTAPAPGSQTKASAGDTSVEAAAAEPEPKPESGVSVLKGPKYDVGDEGAPKLKRGKPVARAKSAPVEEASTVAVATTESNVSAGSPSPTDPAADPRMVFIEEAKSASTGFLGSLPNFVCAQQTTRYVSEAKGKDWQAVDVLAVDVVYDGGREKYEHLTINGKPSKKPAEESGAWSTGEFGTVLADLFSPSTAAKFRYSRTEKIAGFEASVYKFDVQRPNSHWKIYFRSQWIMPAYRGSLWLDKKTARVLRIEMQATDVPKEFLADTTESAVDYELVSLGAQKFLLPVHAEVLTCMRGTSTCDKNVIEFRNYHKFSGESTIQFAK
ncbi:MAG: hypothetical protein M3Y27_02175 [Acidobacteriota bacterium]|nr:hypothetical protein [Acidobacteriota bacterium]